MKKTASTLRTAIVGCKRGKNVAQHLAGVTDFAFAAVCDLDAARAEEAARALGGLNAYTDVDAMLAAEKPDVVFIATNTPPRAALTIRAAEAGVPGIIAEKPMAMSLGEARAMMHACDKAGARIIVTHQRRMGSDLVEMRALIDEGAIGPVRTVRAGCAGDLLSDGTHALDSMRWLIGDPPAEWVLGQVFRVVPDGPGYRLPEFEKQTGFRFGHPVEAGTVSAIQFASGVRGELLTGRAQPLGRPYQDYEVVGDRGRLSRPGDKDEIFIWDEQPGGWRPAPIRPQNRRADGMAEAWKAFAAWLRGEVNDHPLSGASGLADHELVMAIYESARLTARVDLPLAQEAFPLQLMIDGDRRDQAQIWSAKA